MKYLYFLFLLFPFTLFGQNNSVLITHGGSLSDEFLDVIATSDSGYAAVGVSSSFSLSADVFLVKVNKNGLTEWSRAIGGTGIDWGYKVIQLPDSGYVIAGFTSSYGAGSFDGVIYHTDKLGFNVSYYLFGGSDWDFFYDLTQTADSGFIAVGKTYSGTNGYSNAWAVKLNKLFQTEWSKSYGGLADETAQSIIQTFDTNYVFCGSSSSYTYGETDAWLVKINDQGDTLFTRHFGDSLSENAFVVVEHVLDSGYVLGGESHSFSGSANQTDGMRVKYSKTGQIQWFHVDGNPVIDDVIYDYAQFPDGKLIACGKTGYGAGMGDVLNYITDPYGWWMPYSPTYGGSNEDYGRSITKNLSGKYIIAGRTFSFGAGSSDGLIIYADSVSNNYTAFTNFGSDSLVGIYNSKPTALFTLYPNPSSGFLNIEMKNSTVFTKINILNAQGDLIYSFNGRGSSHFLSLPDIYPGFYITEIWVDDVPQRSPFVIVR